MRVKLTEKQVEVLRGLEWLHLRPDQCARSDGWATPMNFGGTDASHHSATAKRLVGKGWVERKDFHGWGGHVSSCGYKITAAGIAALADHDKEPQS